MIAPVDEIVSRAPPCDNPLDVSNGRYLAITILIGALLGALTGFLLRPSVPGTGKLPFETVITAGANLDGLGLLLKPTARQSFQYLVLGFIFGGISGLIFGGLTRPHTSRRRAAPDAGTGAFCANCGQAMSPTTPYCARCGVKRGSIAPRRGA